MLHLILLFRNKNIQLQNKEVLYLRTPIQMQTFLHLQAKTGGMLKKENIQLQAKEVLYLKMLIQMQTFLLIYTMIGLMLKEENILPQNKEVLFLRTPIQMQTFLHLQVKTGGMLSLIKKQKNILNQINEDQYHKMLMLIQIIYIHFHKIGPIGIMHKLVEKIMPSLKNNLQTLIIYK